MKPLATLTRDLVAPLRGFLFDLDDTFLEHGQVLPAALQALYRLKEAGLELYAVTGRAAGWGAVVAHQWPIDGAVCENGNLAFVRENARIVGRDPLDRAARAARREELERVVSELRLRNPELEPSDDAWQRVSDFTFDIGEYRRVPADVVARVRGQAHALGASTIQSSVHLHVSLDRSDKASGTLRLLAARHGLDPYRLLSAYAFIGDSENDAACFNAFRLTFGVKNLSGRPTLTPKFVAPSERARGFVEVTELLLARRAELW
jgi:HAD superfamily hydrolase (TIGR01484 family)